VNREGRPRGTGPAFPIFLVEIPSAVGYAPRRGKRKDIVPDSWDIHAQAQLGHLTLPRSGAGQGPGRAFGRRRTRVRAEGNVARSHAAAGSTVNSTGWDPGVLCSEGARA
jgi:hypothetical protein